ncbi:MAG: DUF2461 domain-containing protein [Pseudomonadota bacterium]
MAASPHGFTDRSFKFLADLAKNNEREWFNDNKALFHEVLEAPFLALLEDLSDRLSDADIPLKGGKKTMFRMNRDVRFSKDKRRYKENVAGLLTPSGTKKEMAGLVYCDIRADGGMAAAGYYNLAPKALGPMRDKMVADEAGFQEALDALSAAGLSLKTENALSTMPRGFTEHADHPHAWAIKLKSVIVMEPMPKTAWKSGDVADRVERIARGAMPLFQFFAPDQV